jgi:alpha-mannosidase
MKTLTLVCNSHIDPVWLWPWEEGLAATLATFRSAASLCEEFDGFVFCHNEALLYRWVEEHEPPLFDRIRRLVSDGRWHVMGGWYLQPDCNLPAGESLVRQVLVGKTYFLEKFGVEPRVAVNLDPFGHTRGLVQILAKSGYEGYLFCRPDAKWLPLPSCDFTWVGFDGSSIAAHRADEHYNSELGHARSKVERWLAAHEEDDRGLLLWGVGNHGGGPSRADLRAIEALQAGQTGRRILHGRPEDYFRNLKAGGELPRVERDLNPWAAGCYTSMARVKHAHARLERLLYSAEALATNAAAQGLMLYPAADLMASLEDLLYSEFHDILPGEGTVEVERQALDRLGHGLEIAGRVRARVFFAMIGGQRPAEENEFPLFVLNHHPFAPSGTVVCEFQPPEPNPDPDTFWEPVVTDPAGRPVAAQIEKESCNIKMDQRKRLVLAPAPGTIEPLSTTRFSCRLEARRTTRPWIAASPPDVPLSPVPGIEISAETGLLTRFEIDGFDYVSGEAFRPLLVRDTADPWGMKVRAFRDVVGAFLLMRPADAASFAGVPQAKLPPIRVIERGPVRTVVEALFSCGRSAVALRYKIPTDGRELEVEVRVAWFERDRMLKIGLPTHLDGGEVLAQTAYGVERVSRRAEELCGHRWLAMVSPDGTRALTLINDTTYGFDVADGEIRVSLLRAPAYAGHPVTEAAGKPAHRPAPHASIVRADRFEPREDQGEHVFRFWLSAGDAGSRLSAIDREASARTEDLLTVCAFPSGQGRAPVPGLSLDDEAIRLGALKMSEDGRRVIVRLFEPTGHRRATWVTVPALDVRFHAELGPFEIRTFAVDLDTHTVTSTDLLERPEPRP